jgi:hypothetical protein
MTIEDLKTKSNEELNQLAHELMGFCWHGFEEIADGRLIFNVCRKCNERELISNRILIPALANYCNNIADAWKLVEFAEKPDTNGLVRYFNLVRDENYLEFTLSKVVLSAGDRIVYFDELKDVPKAITQAFILSMSEETK